MVAAPMSGRAGGAGGVTAARPRGQWAPQDATLRSGGRPWGLQMGEDFVLPGQLEGERQQSPEQRLCWAVLEDALRCVSRPTARAGLVERHTPQATSMAAAVLAVETREWIASDDASWPFSFVRICDALDLSVSALRAGIARGMLGGWPRLRAQPGSPRTMTRPYPRSGRQPGPWGRQARTAGKRGVTP